jgi:hypothetical protein
MRAPKYIVVLAFLLMGISSMSPDTYPQKSRTVVPAIPRTWDDAQMATLEIPLADPIGSPKHVSAEYYYRIPCGQFTRATPSMRPVMSRLDIWIG